MRKTANAFGLSRASVSGIVRRLGKAITEHMGPTYIAMPTSQEAVMHHVSTIMVCLSAWELLTVPILTSSNVLRTPPITSTGRAYIL